MGHDVRKSSFQAAGNDSSLVADTFAEMLAAKSADELEKSLNKIGEFLTLPSAVAELRARVSQVRTSVLRCLCSAMEANSLSETAEAVAEELMLMTEGQQAIETFEAELELVPAAETRMSICGEDATASACASPLHISVVLPQPRELVRARHAPIPLMLWPSSILLANALLSVPEIVRDKDVLEIGCGAHGIVGVVAARVGAASVLVTDGDSDAVSRTSANLKRNLDDCHVQAAVMDWNCLDDCEEIAPASTFSVLLAADVIHDSETPMLVVSVLRRFLAPTGTAFLVNPRGKHRFGVETFLQMVEGSSDLFVDVIPISKGITTQARQSELHDDCLEYDLYRLRWNVEHMQRKT